VSHNHVTRGIIKTLSIVQHILGFKLVMKPLQLEVEVSLKIGASDSDAIGCDNTANSGIANVAFDPALPRTFLCFRQGLGSP
jgi:hypothetical protein